MKEQTKLQEIIAQKADQIRIAIEKAIEAGAKIIPGVSYSSLLECCSVDGVYLQKNTSDGSISVVLDFHSEKIAKIFEPSKDDLEKLAEQKRAELEKIEKQIKEMDEE